ncbi:MarR family winged helix-turn-helix transcriptional regulator [Nocardia seriolae]|uniref:MarR family transcriptional regulator n=1 Tax=Nocardia seriolae TaxID=37332 RepID=A0A0B8N3T7_9NOCA|nr:MarR family transcriptional regulator [Nocardia seriolae]MTJ60142.1 MarR family transcriptional regulator [Nocardia seriolae]MTJ71807.1 MarR family transcriptional regulator [Nocardia seriolae]MTJ85138.1 MarR family transcriptional regulator [Nocardia seriolae]MTK29132.1 MarR family transcriptional regulator [Nocardia seriolae]MTK38074.1 MarR family transcriptional regulator [Nocardia seriolae]
MPDAVDQITAAWRQERPDVDTSPMEIFGRLSRLGRIVDRELTDFFRTQGLERWEFDVLATLRRSGNESGLSAGALNKAAMITSGAITNRIDRLTAKGWAERVPDAHDRRAIRVHLTDTGRDLIDRILPLHMANEQRLLAALSPTDRETLIPLLRKFSESLGDLSLD